MVPTNPTQFIMLGGFLGAGKTTAIARMAQELTQAGHQVGLVTNDQSHDLVDTQSLRNQGFSVGEVPGACFCCKFDELVDTLAELENERRPDVIIAEPVGSCTDLVATVLEPLRKWHDIQYRVGPLGVLLKPEHGTKILRSSSGRGFSPKAAYIFIKQIEEAQIVAINKVDKLSTEETNELVDLVRDRFPDKIVIPTSARSGLGMPELLHELMQSDSGPFIPIPIDYQVYAEGEAELGWLNATFQINHTRSPFTLNRLVLDILSQFQQALDKCDAEPAHLKISAHHDTHVAIGNLVDSAAPAELSRLATELPVEAALVTVNARVIIDPKQLEAMVLDVITGLRNNGKECTVQRMDHFRPAPPTPTHRLVER